MAKSEKSISLRIPEELLTELDEFVDDKKEETDRTRSKWIIFAIKKLLK